MADQKGNDMMKITAECLGETLFIGTAKQVDEFIMVETPNYTRMYLPEEFEQFIKERNYNIA